MKAPLSFASLLLVPMLLSQPMAEEQNFTPLGVEAYGSLPYLSNFDLSPDGSKLAYVQNNKGQLMLVVYDIGSGKHDYVVQSDNHSLFFRDYEWANNHVLLLAVEDIRSERIKYSTTRLFMYDTEGSRKLELVIKPREGEMPAQFQDGIVSMLPDDPDNILMQVAYDVVGQPAVYKVNLKNKGRSQVQRNSRNVLGWIADRQGHVRLAFGREGTRYFYELLDENGQRRPLFEYQLFAPEKVTVKGFGKDPQELYFTALKDGRDALYKMRLDDPARKRELVYADAEYDVSGRLLYSPVDGEIAGFSHSEAEGGRVYWEPRFQKLQAALGKAIPNAFNRVQDMSQDGNKYLVYSESDSDSGSYFLGDRQSQQLTYIGSEYPDAMDDHLHPAQKLTFKARDGLAIEAYLTLPAGYRTGVSYPSVIMPHGGPASRSFNGFDYWASWLAEQGYLVLRPNFRGSAGYGYDFAMAAIQKWGQEMQDDLQDAARYLVQQGYTDGQHTCVVGASYGGYAALMSQVKHGADFRCAASIGGVSDLQLLVSKARFFTNKEVIRAQLGSDDDKLSAASPVNFAAKFSGPVLLIHGSDDDVVPVEHSRYMASALKSAGKEVSFIEQDSGDHYLSYQPYRIEMLQQVKLFLDKNLR